LLFDTPLDLIGRHIKQTVFPAILDLRNCGHSSGRLAEKLGQKNKSKRHFQFFLPSFFRQLKARGQTSSIKPRITAVFQTTFHIGTR
jgi:hypothetical protein